MARRIVELFIHGGAAETRAALVVNDIPQRFFFLPAVGDEALRPLAAGDICLGQVKTVDKAIGGVFVDLGNGSQGFAQLKPKSPKLCEGDKALFRVKRPALDNKGPVLNAAWRNGLNEFEADEFLDFSAQAHGFGRLGRGSGDLIQELIKSLGEKPTTIQLNLAARVPKLERAMPESDVNFAENPFRDQNIDAWIEQSLRPKVELSGGVQLLFSETDGPCVVDVDSGGLGGKSSSDLNDKTNKIAANALAAELMRRAIGGRIVVDFLPSTSSNRREEFRSVLQTMVKQLGGRSGILSKDGLFDFTLPCTQRSLLEHTSHFVYGGFIRPGRQTTIDWRAKEAVRSFEDCLQTERSARLRLNVGADLFAYLEKFPQWQKRLADTYGQRFEIVHCSQIEGRAYDIAR